MQRSFWIWNFWCHNFCYPKGKGGEDGSEGTVWGPRALVVEIVEDAVHAFIILHWMMLSVLCVRNFADKHRIHPFCVLYISYKYFCDSNSLMAINGSFLQCNTFIYCPVSIESKLLVGWWFDSLLGQRFFSLPLCPDQLWDPTQTSVQWVLGALIPGVKWPGC